MSRCAHAQSEYQLTQLPKCSRCKIELTLTTAIYNDNIKTLQEEWECSRCGKVVPKRKLPEPKWTQQDIELHEWCIKNDKSRGTSQQIYSRNY